jgi:hypothetical protein
VPASASSIQTGRAGNLSTAVEATCRAGPVGAELVVRYEVRAAPGLISRVRLIVDDEEAEDSGELAQAAYARIATLVVAPGQRHRYVLEAETPGSAPVEVAGRIDCPGESTEAL